MPKSASMSTWRFQEATYPRPTFTPQNSFKINSSSQVNLPRSTSELYMGSVNTNEQYNMETPLHSPLTPTPPRLSNGRLTALIIVLLAGLLFSVIDTTIVSTALVTIASDLANFQDMYWVVLAYMLSYLGCAIGFAKLSDHFGRLAVFMMSWMIFAAFSIGCGCAKTMTELIAFRALQGVGGSGLYSLSQICLAEVAPHGKNAMIGTLIGMTLATSFVLGPLLGGAISYRNWHWIFWMNIPAGFISVLGLVLLWPKGFGKPRHPWKQVWRIDIIGNVFILAACVLMVFSLQQAGTMTYSWTSIQFLVAFAMSLVCWALFWGWQIILRHLPIQIEPVFPIRLVHHRIYIAALAAMFLGGYSYLAIIITLPERFQIVNGDSSLMAGVHLLPMLGATAMGSIIGGMLSKTKNNTSRTLIAAGALQVLGLGLLTTFDVSNAPVEPQYGYQVIFGLGVGLTFSSATILTKVHASGTDHAVAQGAMAQVRVLGGAIGLVVCTIVFNLRLEDLRDDLTNDQMEALRRSPMAIMRMDVHDAQKIKDAFSESFSNMVWIMFFVSLAGFVASLLTWENHPATLDSLDEAAAAAADTPSGSGGMDGNRNAPGPRHKQIGSRGGSDTELEDLASIGSRRGPASFHEARPATPSPRVVPMSRRYPR